MTVHPDRKRLFAETAQDSVIEMAPSRPLVNGRARSRWNCKSKIHVPGLPTALPANLAPEQVESYVLHMRIEEIHRKLRADDVMPSVERRGRSPSPEPVYGADGKRVNTKEWRYKQKLEREKQDLIKIGAATIPGFRMTGEVKLKNQKFSDKIYIPARENPLVNFIGLLIGKYIYILQNTLFSNNNK
jgi:splicing factor 1